MAKGRFVAYYRVSTEKQGRSGLPCPPGTDEEREGRKPTSCRRIHALPGPPLASSKRVRIGADATSSGAAPWWFRDRLTSRVFHRKPFMECFGCLGFPRLELDPDPAEPMRRVGRDLYEMRPLRRQA